MPKTDVVPDGTDLVVRSQLTDADSGAAVEGGAGTVEIFDSDGQSIAGPGPMVEQGAGVYEYGVAHDLLELRKSYSAVVVFSAPANVKARKRFFCAEDRD